MRASRRMASALWVMAGLAGVAAPALAQERLRGRIRADGSSTVAPITMAAAELYQSHQPRVQVTVGISGTGGGFKKFLEERADLRTDISDASRPIKPVERRRAAELGVKFIELPIAYDGIAVVVHPSNEFAKTLTVDELKRIWQPESKINNWRDVRAGFPDLPLRLYGPGADSGTFDYFIETVVGRPRACRSDFTASEDDNVLVQGVAGDRGALGYFGFSYYEANAARLALVAIDGGAGPVAPTMDAIRNGTYAPLSRPIFLYVNSESAQRPEVRSFIKHVYDNARSIVEHPKVGYVALSDSLYATIWKRFETGVTGSVYEAPDAGSKSLDALYGNPQPE